MFVSHHPTCPTRHLGVSWGQVYIQTITEGCCWNTKSRKAPWEGQTRTRPQNLSPTRWGSIIRHFLRDGWPQSHTHLPTHTYCLPKQMILKAESTSLLPLGSCFLLYNSFFSTKKLGTLLTFGAEMNKTDLKKKKGKRVEVKLKRKKQEIFRLKNVFANLEWAK